jgi:hypothetical protein
LGVVVNGVRSGQSDYYGHDAYTSSDTRTEARREGRKGPHLTIRGR